MVGAMRKAPAVYDPILRVNPDKFIFASRMFGDETWRKKMRPGTIGKCHKAHVSTLRRYAAALHCNVLDLVDLDSYWETEGAPVWAVQMATFDLGLDRYKLRRLIKRTKTYFGHLRHEGLDPKKFLGYIFDGAKRDDYSARAAVTAKWLCQDGGGPVVWAVLSEMMNKSRLPREELAEAVKEAMLRAYDTTEEP